MKLNGETVDEFAGTVAQLLDSRTIRREGVAVAVNGEIIPRSEWSVAVLPFGCHIEIVTASAGG